jgi:hypothetical protein
MNTALFDLIEGNDIDPDKVKQLRVTLSPTVFDRTASSPDTRRNSTRSFPRTTPPR